MPNLCTFMILDFPFIMKQLVSLPYFLFVSGLARSLISSLWKSLWFWLLCIFSRHYLCVICEQPVKTERVFGFHIVQSLANSVFLNL